MHKLTITEGLRGTFLETPYINDGKESLEKCLYTWGTGKEGEGNTIWTHRCRDHSSSDDNPWHGWKLVDTGRNQFMMKHKMSGRCAMTHTSAVGASVFTYSQCDGNNTRYKWTKK